MRRLRKTVKLLTNENHKFFSYKLTQEEEYSLQLQATLFLDEQCYLFNKDRLSKQINEALLQNDEMAFRELSELYSNYL
ncbi:IDEAL domain-containing protein [Bacillus suaedaesalsae]|uniref:IDEAL domain-containing protein n=1 Tax=Bacillus suaedaesalsae TaxID=2810349 RepID=A0ABS2DGR4_9BACI|nr:IDEAL domain-containing protein [Bacillus suaedaesalsae]MBM6617658.1 IDEAL domain-containing protein [Bacillus suaedaesalsae]